MEDMGWEILKSLVKGGLAIAAIIILIIVGVVGLISLFI